MRVNATATTAKAAAATIRKQARSDGLVGAIMGGPTAVTEYLDGKGALSAKDMADTIRSMCVVLSFLMSEKHRSHMDDEQSANPVLLPAGEAQIIDPAKATRGRFAPPERREADTHSGDNV